MDPTAALVLKHLKGIYSPVEFPCLHQQIEEWSETKPLNGLRILDASPIFKNSLIKFAALHAAGAELSLAVPSTMPCDPEAVQMAQDYGWKLVEPENQGCVYDILLDCAGSLSALPARIGYVELTKSGEQHYGKHDLPVFLVDSGRIKEIETCLGTGESFFRAMAQIGHPLTGSDSLLVIGYGKVGKGIVWHALKTGVDVVIVDMEPKELPPGCELILGHQKEKLAQALSDATVCVTATGAKHAVSHLLPLEDILASPARFTNMGVEDEWGPEIPAVRVLNNKEPLNFLLKDPTLMKFIDPPLALHNYGAIALAERNELSPGINIPAAEVEEAFLQLIRERGMIENEDLELI